MSDLEVDYYVYECTTPIAVPSVIADYVCTVRTNEEEGRKVYEEAKARVLGTPGRQCALQKRTTSTDPDGKILIRVHPMEETRS